MAANENLYICSQSNELNVLVLSFSDTTHI